MADKLIVSFEEYIKIVEKLAIEKGHEIVLKTSSKSSSDEIKKADVAIDFSIPTAAVNNIKLCLNTNIPIIGELL